MPEGRLLVCVSASAPPLGVVWCWWGALQRHLAGGSWTSADQRCPPCATWAWTRPGGSWKGRSLQTVKPSRLQNRSGGAWVGKCCRFLHKANASCASRRTRIDTHARSSCSSDRRFRCRETRAKNRTVAANQEGLEKKSGPGSSRS